MCRQSLRASLWPLELYLRPLFSYSAEGQCQEWTCSREHGQRVGRGECCNDCFLPCPLKFWLIADRKHQLALDKMRWPSHCGLVWVWAKGSVMCCILSGHRVPATRQLPQWLWVKSGVGHLNLKLCWATGFCCPMIRLTASHPDIVIGLATGCEFNRKEFSLTSEDLCCLGSWRLVVQRASVCMLYLLNIRNL